MNYTYEIAKITAPGRFMRVIYSAEGHPDRHMNFNPVDFSKAALVALIEGAAPGVIMEWERIATLPEIDEVELGVGVPVDTSYVEPEPPVIPPPTFEEQAEARIDSLAAERVTTEHQGILWTDAQGDTFVFDSSLDSQNRFTAASAAMNKGNRTDGGVWKCGAVDEVGGVSLAFRPMTNNELSDIADLVHLHVQKCFEAEAICVAAVMGGNLEIDYQGVYDSL